MQQENKFNKKKSTKKSKDIDNVSNFLGKGKIGYLNI